MSRLTGFLCLLVFTTPCAAQFTDKEPSARLGKEQKQRWKVGIVVRAPRGGACIGIFGTAPVPTEWPEQEVRIVEEEITPQVKGVRYRTLANGVKQMLVTIPKLDAGQTAKALLTFEVTKRTVLPPDDTSQYQVPTRLPRQLRPYLGASPYIEVRNSKIRSAANEVTAGKEGAWETVESIYDWVRDNVEYKNGKLKGAAAALKDGTGDCEELTSLFIAMCRIKKIPARTVWIPGHCYPEFYLADAEGKGHWFPCQAAGTRQFGGMEDFKPILQKGDNFRVPEKREPQRYVAEFLQAKAVRGSGQPSVQFMRVLLPSVPAAAPAAPAPGAAGTGFGTRATPPGSPGAGRGFGRPGVVPPGTGTPGTGTPGTGVPGRGVPGTGIPGRGLPGNGVPGTPGVNRPIPGRPGFGTPNGRTP